MNIKLLKKSIFVLSWSIKKAEEWAGYYTGTPDEFLYEDRINSCKEVLNSLKKELKIKISNKIRYAQSKSRRTN